MEAAARHRLMGRSFPDNHLIMESNFFAYLQRLELIAFFSGFPLIYAIALYFSGKQLSEKIHGRVLFLLLPFGYALVGTLYLGLQLKNLYPGYSIENIKQNILYNPFLIAWATLVILFWIPAIAKKPVLSLLHSLVFFYLLIKDLISQSLIPRADKIAIRNDMKLYTVSLLLNLGTLLVVLLAYFMNDRFKKSKNPAHP